MANYPVSISLEEYQTACNKTIRIQLWATIACATVGFLIFSVVIYNIAGEFPVMKIGERELSSLWFIAFFFSLFTIMAVLEILRNRKEGYSPNRLKEFYANRTRVSGIYVESGAGKHHTQKVYEDSGEIYQVYAPVPFKYYSLKPLVCRAFLVGNTALVYEIIKELDQYKSSEEYVMEMRRKGRE